MTLAKHLDRARYIVRTPGHFAELLSATVGNKWHAATRSWGPRRARCNLCGWEGRRFDNYLERYFILHHEQCPQCGSLERNRELVRILERSEQLRGVRVLEVAPAKGFDVWFRSHGARYVSLDLGHRASTTRMDLTRLAFPPNTFDIVICSHVLEHIIDHAQAIAEIHRVLRPGGHAYIDVPFSREYATYRLDPPGRQGHVHEFGIDIIDRIRDAGFNVTVEKYRPTPTRDAQHNEFFLATKV